MAGGLLACGGGAEPALEPQATPDTESASRPEVTAQACVQLYRPAYTSYWDSFPIRDDGQVGGCETAPDCTTTCWGTDSPYVIHQNFFYCTYCPSP
jgi:hypothetical protein